MFKCSECKRLYKERVDYCDCGNNEFEEVPDTPQPSQNAAPANSPAVPELARPILPVNLISIIVFSVCCIFSLCFVLFLGPEPKKREKVPNTTEKVVVKDIPDIDEIWDDTPAYNVPADANAGWSSYEPGLINALLAQFILAKYEGGGTCDIEFVLDRHGNLKKKKLYQNSANKPLLASAKKMLSSVRSYNPPPKDYDGSPIVFEFYEVDDTYSLRAKK